MSDHVVHPAHDAGAELALLRSIDPVPDPRVLPGADDAGPRALLQAIQSSAVPGARDHLAPSPRRRTPRARLAAAVAVPVAALGLAAAGWSVTHRPASDVTTVLCADAPQADAGGVVLQHDGDPIGRCRRVWLAGEVTGEVGRPQLTACVGRSGVLTVIPARGAEACATAGLADADGLGRSRPEAARAMAVTDVLREALGEDCVSRPDAIGLARSVLAANEMEDWTVVASPATRAADCAMLVHEPQGTIRFQMVARERLVPGSPPHEPATSTTVDDRPR